MVGEDRPQQRHDRHRQQSPHPGTDEHVHPEVHAEIGPRSRDQHGEGKSGPAQPRMQRPERHLALHRHPSRRVSIHRYAEGARHVVGPAAREQSELGKLAAQIGCGV